jgi:hypothetical protein
MGQGQTQVILVPESGFVTQGAARDPENLAGAPLGYPDLLPGLDDCASQDLGRQPVALEKSRLSFAINLSRLRWDPIFLNRRLFSSSAFSSVNCERRVPPNFLRHVQYVASLIPANRQAVATSATAANSTARARYSFVLFACSTTAAWSKSLQAAMNSSV